MDTIDEANLELTDVDEATEVRRITIKLTPEAYDELRSRAKARNLTLTGLIRKALATDRFFYDHRDAQVLLRDGSSTREVVLLHD